MVETEDGWRLGSHIQMDSLTLILFLQIDTLDQSVYSMTSFDVENPAQYFSSRLEQLLAEAEAEMCIRDSLYCYACPRGRVAEVPLNHSPDSPLLLGVPGSEEKILQRKVYSLAEELRIY